MFCLLFLTKKFEYSMCTLCRQLQFRREKQR